MRTPVEAVKTTPAEKLAVLTTTPGNTAEPLSCVALARMVSVRRCVPLTGARQTTLCPLTVTTPVEARAVMTRVLVGTASLTSKVVGSPLWA